MGKDNDKSPDDTNLTKIKDKGRPPSNRPQGRLFKKPKAGPASGPIGPSKSKPKKR